MEYIANKVKFKKKDISAIEIFFDNGDYISVLKNEIVDISTRLYDKLVLQYNYWNSYCAEIESGFLKLKLKKQQDKSFYSYQVSSPSEYKKDRAKYIQNRLCSDDGITCIKIFSGDFDENEDIFTLNCRAKAKMEDQILVIEFIPREIEKPFSSQTHSIILPEITKTMIRKLELDLENCEVIDILPDEIVDIKLNFEHELCSCYSDYTRKIKSGLIKIKLASKWDFARSTDSWTQETYDKNKISQRLCGKNGFDLHDLTHLYIEFNYAGYGTFLRECIEIDDIRSKNELCAIEKYEDEHEQEFFPCFVGGYAEMLDKNIILITFGTTATENEKCQQKLKEVSVFNR